MSNFYEENKDFISPSSKQETNQNKIKAGIMTYLPSVILTLILVTLSGLGALIQFNFTIKEIVWGTFFISLGLRLISNFLSKYVGSNLCYNRALYSEEMQKIKSDFVLAGQDVERDLFEDYVNQYNLTQKKKAYKKKKCSKIQKFKSKIKILTFKNNLECKAGRDKKLSKLKNKVSALESITSDDYIDKNITYIKVKYKKVRSYYFLSPSEDYFDDSIQYSVNFSRENTKEIIRTLPITVALVTFSALLSYDAIMGNINAVSVLFDIGNMIFNFIIGWVTVGKKIVAKMMNAYINRQTFILKFKSTNTSVKKVSN